MSLEEQARRELAAIDPAICEWCGGSIDDEPQECPALDDGRCAP
jgi:hypothetical protein